MRAKKSPHITRNIPAASARFSIILCLNRWLFLIIFLLINAYIWANLKPIYWADLTHTLASPSNQTFNQLARTYRGLGFIEAGKQILRFNQSLSPVLGADTESRELLEQWGDEPNQALAEYNFWLEKTKLYPNHRDAALQLAAAAHHLGKFSEARLAANTAITIDPNSSFAKKLLDLIKDD